MVAPETVRRLLEALREYSAELQTLSRTPVDDYSGSEAYAGRYLVQSAAQACIDLCNHLIASEGWRSPRDSRDTFTVLEEHSILSSDLGRSNA